MLKDKEDLKTTTFRIPDDLFSLVPDYIGVRGLSKSKIIRSALTNYIKLRVYEQKKIKHVRYDKKRTRTTSATLERGLREQLKLLSESLSVPINDIIVNAVLWFFEKTGKIFPAIEKAVIAQQGKLFILSKTPLVRQCDCEDILDRYGKQWKPLRKEEPGEYVTIGHSELSSTLNEIFERQLAS